jgi:hypothetical protein
MMQETQLLHRKTDPSLVEEEATFLNTFMSRREHKSWSQILTRPEAKNECAGEDQQQFNWTTEWNHENP